MEIRAGYVHPYSENLEFMINLLLICCKLQISFVRNILPTMFTFHNAGPTLPTNL